MIEVKEVTQSILCGSGLFKDYLIDCPYSLEESPNGKLLALAAYKDSLPVGLCVTFYYPAIHSAFIAHFFVAPESRGQGVATAISEKMLSHLKSNSIHSIEVRFSSIAEGSAAIEKLLNKFHFTPPEIQTIEYRFDITRFNAPWYLKPPRIQKSMSIFPWRNHTKKEMELIAHWAHEHPTWFPFTPIGLNQPIDLITSLGLRKKGQLIGWMINVKPRPDTLKFSSLFILPEERGTGAAIALLANSIALHRKLSPECRTIAAFNPRLSPPLWTRFVQNRLVPYSIANNYILFSNLLDF